MVFPPRGVTCFCVSLKTLISGKTYILSFIHRCINSIGNGLINHVGRFDQRLFDKKMIIIFWETAEIYKLLKNYLYQEVFGDNSHQSSSWTNRPKTIIAINTVFCENRETNNYVMVKSNILWKFYLWGIQAFNSLW